MEKLKKNQDEADQPPKVCSKSPDGIHALPFPIPPDPIWYELSEENKKRSQFCIYCGAAIW